MFPYELSSVLVCFYKRLMIYTHIHTHINTLHTQGVQTGQAASRHHALFSRTVQSLARVCSARLSYAHAIKPYPGLHHPAWAVLRSLLALTRWPRQQHFQQLTLRFTPATITHTTTSLVHRPLLNRPPLSPTPLLREHEPPRRGEGRPVVRGPPLLDHRARAQLVHLKAVV